MTPPYRRSVLGLAGARFSVSLRVCGFKPVYQIRTRLWTANPAAR